MEPSNNTPQPTTPRTPGEIAALAAQLDSRREQLAKAREGLAEVEARKLAAIRAANAAYGAAVNAANSEHDAQAGPLAESIAELTAQVSDSESAATELEARKARAAELAELLRAATAELPEDTPTG